jgi:hypothetical protein
MVPIISRSWAAALAALALTSGAFAAPPRANRAPERDDFGYLIEPWVGGTYGSYQGDLTGSVPVEQSLTLIGPGFGSLLGLIYRNWYFGARVQYFMLSNSDLGQSPKNLGLGAFVGYTLSALPMRIWAGFNFIDELNNGSRTLKADCYSLGAGWMLNDKVSINLEYNMRSYNRVLFSSTQIEPKFSNLVVSISRPFALDVESQHELAKGLASDGQIRRR